MLGGFFAPDLTPILEQGDLVLRAGIRADYSQWRRTRLKSMAFLTPFEPSWSEIDLSRNVYRQRLRRTRQEAMDGTDFSFLIFCQRPRQKDELVGGITLSNVRRRAAQQGQIGYWMAVDHAGKGYMTQAVGRVSRYAFDQLGLNRLQASCLPDNTPSRRVLEKNGFIEEGYAEKYLQINGAWRDHVLYGVTRDRFRAQPPR